MSDADLNALAASLADTASSLAEHIERRARDLAEPAIAAAEAKACEQVGKMETLHAHETQRKDDLIAELRRQLNAQVKAADRLNREVKGTRAAIRRVEELQVWRNEDRRQFVFAEEMWAALAEVGNPSTRHLAELKHREAAR